MQKLLLLTLLITFSIKNYAQVPSNKVLTLKDSMDVLKDFITLEKEGAEKTTSYFTASLGLGNKLFSAHNNALNAKRSVNNTLIYSPAVAYINKSGFTISAAAFLLNDTATGFDVNQYSISPGYQLPENDYVDFSIVYAHFFVNNKFSNYSSPIQNDLYTAFTYKKTWLQPGVALDFSNGKYYEVQRKKKLYDSTTNKLKTFSFIASVGHEFTWEKVFNNEDAFSLSPSFMLNSSSDNLSIHHNTNAAGVATFLPKRSKLTKFQNTKFSAESFGINIDASYVIGKLTIAPEMYLDYYLPATTLNRVTTVLALNLIVKL